MKTTKYNNIIKSLVKLIKLIINLAKYKNIKYLNFIIT